MIIDYWEAKPVIPAKAGIHDCYGSGIRLRVRNDQLTNSLITSKTERGAKIVEYTLKIRIPTWLEKPAVLAVLLYRKLRYGCAFRRIPLSQGKYAIVDPDDFQRLNSRKWYVSKRGNTYYAIRGQWSPALKKRLTISMHREVLRVPEGLYVDHINHHGWDNRKANLRPATPADNARNARYPKTNTTSKYRGVWYNKQTRKWRATIRVNRKRKQLGYYDSEEAAGRAYDQAAKHYYGQFAILNFPE